MSLFHHQYEAAAWLAANPRAYLADAMGMGKTRSLLAALARLGDPKALVVCPAIVRGHWRREAGDMRIRNAQVVSYDTIVSGGPPLMREYLGQGIQTLILDEAHYLRHSSAKRTQLLLGPNGYTQHIPRVWLASGTPVPRHPGDLWPVLSRVFPEVVLKRGLTRRDQFVAHYCRTATRFFKGRVVEKVVGVQNVEDFKAILGEIMLRRTASAGLPPVWWQTLDVEGAVAGALDARLQAVYQAGGLEAILSHPEISTYRKHIGLAKVPALAEIVAEELNASSGRVVIFAHHLEVLDALEKRLRSFGVARIDGATSQKERERRLDAFCYPSPIKPDYRVFLGQQDACGTGLDGLQHVTNRLILLEPHWVASQNEQYAARIARTGQQAPTVFVQQVTVAGTLDDGLMRQNERERGMQLTMGTNA